MSSSTATDKGAHLTIQKLVRSDVPATHLVIEVDGVRVLHLQRDRRPDVPDARERVPLDGIAAVRPCPKRGRHTRARVSQFGCHAAGHGTGKKERGA